MTVTEMARNFSRTLDEIEHSSEEVVLLRNGRRVARVIPEAVELDALQVFGDLYRTMDDATAESLQAHLRSERKKKSGRLAELRNPWASS